ncbi:tetratricopeptide repeat protein [Aliifodinibius sp. S!AR15-10]|uniref:type IX secretion system periplasmic lipoprotein PorW/SprE n=1 Tax=Aliifodinibius sp. S!AR15-10 TaxID=2950437 RepID=UPI00285E3C98|nr:tetratricopeptide repeat protein [Aliifodinibius sp. S!AR15-10]MDR8394406.1 tetratricopeptide repeat protein [Aliifodinibius sp. S!AR15-10]
MKNVFYIALLFFLVGCGGTLKRSWTDFRAYYNTYYNASESFQAGLKQVEDQPEELHADELIRVHKAPVGTGGQEFQNAIDKGAQILRKFPDSKWIDETLELIGKSYYYRQEFYSALQKFEEQYNVAESPEMRQRAVIWKGRVLLDLELYNQGIVFLEDELQKLSDEWDPELHAEAEVMLAEHYVQLQQWQQVEGLLAQALSKLSKGPLKARSFFLYGQILEIGEQFGRAADAYARVLRNRPGFELFFWANYKQAEALRKMGNLEEAFAIYEQMRKDDKNIERLPNIYYEIGRTQEQMGNIETAREIYNQVLRSDIYQVSQETRADIYYRLGQIYTNHLNKYQVAAAYYDSSSSLRNRTQQYGVLQEELNTENLAKAYGEYSKLRNQISHLDSLMWLSSLPQAQFDSVIAEVRQRKLQELQQKQENRRGDANVLTNANARQPSRNDSRSLDAYGFLNHKNGRLVSEARNQFQAVWGNRPLVDNWRRIEAARSASEEQDSLQDEQLTQGESSQETEYAQVEVDLSEIPFTEEQKAETRDQLGSAKFELGNLFLLTLQQPDSASYYFRSVVEEHPNHNLAPKALYSLYELYSSEGELQQANRWADRLRDEYPDSRYTRQLRIRRGGTPPPEKSDSTAMLPGKADSILSSTASTAEIAKELRNLALANKGAEAAPLVHFESIKRYIQLAKQRDNIMRDSVVTYSLAVDSTDTTASVTNVRMQYEGAYWDSVRVVLKEHIENFTGQPVAEKVGELSREVEKKDESELQSLPTCRERKVEPEIQGGMSSFLQNVKFPEKLKNANLSGTVEYEMTITREGKVGEFGLVSEKTDLGIEEAFSSAIQDSLSFVPLDLDENTPSVRCTISFPISQ